MQRGKSLFGSGFQQNQRLIESREPQPYSEIIENLTSRPKQLKRYIKDYQKAAIDTEQAQVYKEFRIEQLQFRRYRENLSEELEHLKHKNNESEYQYVRNELVQAIKQEMNIELQMNDLVSKKKEQKANQAERWRKLEGKSTRVQNALDDILRKRDEIMELENSIKECLQLLKIIGILVEEQGQKITRVEEQVSRANEFIEKAEHKIDQAKERQKRSTRKKCCVIIIGLFAVILILVVLYGFNFIGA